MTDALKKGFPVVILIVACLISCGTSPNTVQSDKFKGKTLQASVNKLAATSDFVYAATDSGMFRQPKAITTGKWESLGLRKASIPSFIPLNNDVILATAQFSAENNAIVKSLDGGQSWILYKKGYGSIYNYPTAFAGYNHTDSTIYAGHSRIHISKSEGKRWRIISKKTIASQIHFLRIDLEQPKVIWAGGENFAGGFDPQPNQYSSLMKSVDGGENWKDVKPKTKAHGIYDLIVDAANHNHVLVGADGIYKSTDGGRNWQHVFKQDSIYTFARSSLHPQTIYASGKKNNSKPFVARSPDFGDSWQTTELPDSLSAVRINDMISVPADSGEVLYFGTNKGVYSKIVE